METFSDRLQRLMKRDRLRQAGVGAAIGKHQTRISGLVNGAAPLAEELVALAALFRVSEAWLLEGREATRPPGLTPEEALIVEIARRVGPAELLARLVEAEASAPPADPGGEGRAGEPGPVVRDVPFPAGSPLETGGLAAPKRPPRARRLERGE